MLCLESLRPRGRLKAHLLQNLPCEQHPQLQSPLPTHRRASWGMLCVAPLCSAVLAPHLLLEKCQACPVGRRQTGWGILCHLRESCKQRVQV